MVDSILTIPRLSTNRIVEVIVINNTNGLFLTGVAPGDVVVDFWALGSAGAFIEDTAITGDGIVDSYDCVLGYRIKIAIEDLVNVGQLTGRNVKS